MAETIAGYLAASEFAATAIAYGATLAVVASYGEHQRRKNARQARDAFNRSLEDRLVMTTTAQAVRQDHGTVADADQAADRVADGLEHAAHLAVAAFGNRHLVPAVRAFAATGFDGAELRHAVVQRHAFEQALFLFIVQRAEHAHEEEKADAHEREHP